MEEDSGIIMVAPQVLVTIARSVTLDTPGVARMSPVPGGFDRFLHRAGGPEGVKVEVEEGVVSVDLFIVAQPQVNMLHLGQEIQKEVARAIQQMVGMPVREVNVHIQDVAFPQEEGVGEGSS